LLSLGKSVSPVNPLTALQLGEDVPMLDVAKDLCGFILVRKKFWLAPVMLLLLGLGALLVLAQGSVIAPFVYTLF
jgi:hypothetical protein